MKNGDDAIRVIKELKTKVSQDGGGKGDGGGAADIRKKLLQLGSSYN